MANDLIPYWEPADSPTCYTSAAVVGKTFVKISAARQTDGQMTVATAGAGERACGVANRDAAINTRVGVVTEGIVPVLVGAGGVTFGQEVQADATGKAIALGAGKSLGIAC